LPPLRQSLRGVDIADVRIIGVWVLRIDATGGRVHLQIWEGMAHAWPAFGDAVPEAAALGTSCRERLSRDKQI
jgi:hypothetical protein